MTPEVVQSTAYNAFTPARNVLILGDEDVQNMENREYNFWLAGFQNTSSQGFTLKVDICARLIAGCQIKNKGKGRFSGYGTKEFIILGSKNKDGPWEALLEGQLNDTRGQAAPLLNFNFEEPVEIKFLKFELVSYWGWYGGGLQYFAPIPATSKQH